MERYAAITTIDFEHYDLKPDPNGGWVRYEDVEKMRRADFEAGWHAYKRRHTKDAGGPMLVPRTPVEAFTQHLTSSGGEDV